MNHRIRVIQNVMRTHQVEFEPIMERQTSGVPCSINWTLDGEQVSDTRRQPALSAGGLRKTQTHEDFFFSLPIIFTALMFA